MSERPNDPGLTPGDPLAPEPDGPLHESGLPAREPERGSVAAEPAPAGYSSPPPPGAFGAPAHGSPAVVATGQYQLAGWWSRVGATLIDGLIVCVGALIIMAIFGSIFSVGFFASEETGIASLIFGLLLSVVAIAIVALLYAPLMMDRTNGKTLGRMAMGIRVVRANGQPMTFGWAMLREVAVKALLFGVAGSLTFGLANLADVLWPLWDDENRALHDFLVDTRTVRD
jgi:uncharacterized RDD family membrane protein YckC